MSIFKSFTISEIQKMIDDYNEDIEQTQILLKRLQERSSKLSAEKSDSCVFRILEHTEQGIKNAEQTLDNLYDAKRRMEIFIHYFEIEI